VSLQSGDQLDLKLSEVQQTQFFLKQSCEQKKEPEMPCFKQVGHCNFAGFPQSGDTQV
jgi:hypothetical protein